MKSEFAQADIRSARLPSRRPVFLDVETTGLRQSDRIVSLGMVRLLWDGSEHAEIAVRSLVFDPQKRSHSGALSVHGLGDWFLRHQPLFGQAAAGIADFLADADGLVGHNIRFDARHLAHGLASAGQAMPAVPLYCTAVMAREVEWSPASLTACAERIGLTRAHRAHDAVEDTLLCLAVWLYARGWVLAALPTLARRYDNACDVPPAPRRLPLRQNGAKCRCSAQQTMALLPEQRLPLSLRRVEVLSSDNIDQQLDVQSDNNERYRPG